MPVIVEPRYDIADLEADLARLYADFPGRPVAECVATVRQALAGGGVFYAGIFNGKAVAGALVCGAPDAREISQIAVRAATRGRGVAQRLVDEIARLELATGGQALTVRDPGVAAAALTQLGFVPGPAGFVRTLSAG